MGLKSLRIEKGWSQEQLAAISGLSERTIQRVERGDMPSLATLQALAASFELTHAQLRELITPLTETSEMASNVKRSSRPPSPTNSVLSTKWKHVLLAGGAYIIVMTWLALMQLLADWDPELLPFAGILGGGFLLTLISAALAQNNETED